MKKHSFLFVLFSFLLPLGMMAQDHVGNWTISFPGDDGQPTTAILMIAADNSYKVDLGSDDVIDVEGIYKMDGENMMIRDTKGPQACGNDQEGVYKLSFEGNQMTMTRVSDACQGRGGPDGVMVFTKS